MCVVNTISGMAAASDKAQGGLMSVHSIKMFLTNEHPAGAGPLEDQRDRLLPS